MIAVSAIGSASCARTPCVQPRRNDMGSVCVANTAISTSGRLLAMMSVLMPSGVSLASPARPSAAPAREWQILSNRFFAGEIGLLGFVPQIFSQYFPDVGFRQVLLEHDDARHLVSGQRLPAVRADGF